MANSPDWITSFEALRSIYTDGAYSNMALNEAIPRHQGCRDSFVRNLVKGVVRQTVTLDYIIGMLARDGLKGIRPRTLIVLRMGLYALRELDSVPDHAAVNEAVSLARKTARGTDRFINAVLRSYIRRRDEFESPAGSHDDPPFIAGITDPSLKFSVRYSMPQGIVSMITDQYGDKAEDILKGLNEPPEVILRVNTLRTTRDELIRSLSGSGLDAEAAAGSEHAVICRGSGIIGSEQYREGLFTVQNLSSIIAIEHLDPHPGDTVLDMCAAPGGKSTMMAELMDNRGMVTACDIHEHRLELIRASAERTGAQIITTRLADGTVYDSSLENSYDCVLADVPCSGLGVIASKPEIRLHTDVSGLAELTDIQLEILENAFRYTKPGGRICYSTCTLNRDENESVVNGFMRTYGEGGSPDDSSKGSSFARIIEMDTILPYNNTIGFYYCIIGKCASHHPDNQDTL